MKPVHALSLTIALGGSPARAFGRIPHCAVYLPGGELITFRDLAGNKCGPDTSPRLD